MDIEGTLISALRNQQMVDIRFKKETTQEWVTREVAPYDVYNKQVKDRFDRKMLSGYCWKHGNYKEAPIHIYLDTISDVRVLNQKFNGQEVRQLINPKEQPQVSRSW